jgi:hypothetical protein
MKRETLLWIRGNDVQSGNCVHIHLFGFIWNEVREQGTHSSPAGNRVRLRVLSALPSSDLWILGAKIKIDMGLVDLLNCGIKPHDARGVATPLFY